jgi:TorA maturation chaperone TorD
MTSNSEQVGTKEWAAMAEYRSRVYGFLAAAYNRLPDEQFAEGLLGLDPAGAFAFLGEADALPEDMRDGLGLIESFARDSQGTAAEKLAIDLAVERTRLLRGLKPDYGPPPAYESVYSSSEESSGVLTSAAVSQIYAEEGVGLPEEVRDQPDFIGLELDFMRHLTAQEAEAWTRGEREEAAETLKKERAFLGDHLARWVPRFCDVIEKEARLGFYQGIAKMTKGFVLDEAEKVEEYLKWVNPAS